MSGPLCAFCNRGFICQLRELGDMNVLLLMVDGSAVFGRLADVPTASGVLRVVQSVGVPFPAGVTGGVVYRPANPDLFAPMIVSQLYVDICDVAFAIWGTFAELPLFCRSLTDDGNSGAHMPYGIKFDRTGTSNKNSESIPTEERQGLFGGYSGGNNGSNNGWCALLAELRELVVRNIGLVTLGGWTVVGQLGLVNDGVALISPATASIPFVALAGAILISGPAIPGGVLIIPTSVSAWANLATLTQILQP